MIRNTGISKACAGLLISMGLWLTPPAMAASSATFTLSQAVNEALKANPSIQAKELALQSAKMNVGVAQSFFWPKLSVMATNNRLKNYEEVQTYNSDNLSSYNWSQGLRATWSIFAGFSHLNGLQKSLLQKDVEKARHRQACLELISNVQMQFLQVLKGREDILAAQDSIKRLEAQLKSAESFVAMDMAPYLNVLQNETDLASARQNLIKIQNDVRNAEVQLNRFLGRSQADHIQYVGKLADIKGSISLSEEEAIQYALAHRPDLDIAKKTIEVAFKDMNIAMASYLPRIDLTYDNMRSSKDYDDGRYTGYTRNYWSAGITFTWEIFSGGQTTFSTLSEKKRAESLKKDYEDAVNGARTEVIRALLDIDAAANMIKVATSGLKTAREGYAMAMGRYETDTGTITELMDAQLRLTQAQNDLSQALFEHNAGRVRFYLYIGQENTGLK